MIPSNVVVSPNQVLVEANSDCFLTTIATLGSLKSHLMLAGHVAAAVGRNHHSHSRGSSVPGVRVTT
jgi:hypothetical protein